MTEEQEPVVADATAEDGREPVMDDKDSEVAQREWNGTAAGALVSADDRDVARELRRQLKLAGGRAGEPRPVQVAGKPLEAAQYAKWRRRAVRRGVISAAPELQAGRYAMVLFAFDPAGAEAFIRTGTAAQLTPPTVGTFLPAVEPAVALAATLAGWLEQRHHERWELAPPLLHTGGHWRVADLGRDWPLAPAGLRAGDREFRPPAMSGGPNRTPAATSVSGRQSRRPTERGGRR